MRFRILGPLHVSNSGGEVALQGYKQRTVLALLLADAGKIVPWERLLDAVWEDDPPATARRQIQNCVAGLRRLVSPERPIILTEGPGYRIVPADGDLDAVVFAERVARARKLSAGGLPAEAATELRSALSLWRGPALFGIPGRVAEAVAARLDDHRLTAIEDCAELELGLGRHDALVGELTALVTAHPLRERLVGQLMLALHRSGRQADAIQAYQRVRTALADELGVDPGAALQRTYTSILSEQPYVVPEGASHLPRAVPDFVGREALLTELADSTATVLSIAGMAGAGKTTLAIQLAYRLADRYPDGRLHVDLRGQDEPLESGAALSILLRQLGVAADRVPVAPDDRATLWRAEAAGRRVLVVLDNAAGSRQVVPLLPGDSGTLVIVTSRRMLAGLDGARAVSLGALPAADAAELLRRVVGARAAGEPADTAELARLCGYLPLALRLAAARLVRRAAWTVADLNERLRDVPGRLRQLAAEDRAVSAALDGSYQQLDEVSREVFRSLSRHGRTGFDRGAAAALAGLDVAAVDGPLEELVDAYLLETPAAGRYQLHDLVHDYAALRLAEEEPDRAEAAERRLLAHYLHTTASATAHYERPVARAGLIVDDPPPTVPVFGGTHRAVAWLDANWFTVVAATELADRTGQDPLTWRLARALWPYLYRNSQNTELVEIHQRGLAAAVRLGDDTAVAIMHSCLAAGFANLKRYDLTERHLRERFATLHRLGDDRGRVITLNNLALLQLHGVGKPLLAVASCQEALELAERIGADHDVYLCARTLGMSYRMLGRFDDALACFQRALAGFESVGEKSWHSVILGELGAVYAAIGDHDTALPLLQRSLELKRNEGNRAGAADVLSWLGEACQAMGRDAEAIEYHREAQGMLPPDHHAESMVLNCFGRTLLAQGDRAQALALHRRVLDLVGRAGNRYEQARAHAGIAAALAGSDPGEARQHREQATVIYAEMGILVDLQRFA